MNELTNDVMQCMNCRRRTTRFEAYDRNFNTGHCVVDNYDLEVVSEPTKASDDELRGQLLNIFHRHVIHEEPYLSKGWSVHGIDAILALITAHDLHQRELWVAEVLRKLPKPENYGNGFDDLVHLTEVTQIIKETK